MDVVEGGVGDEYALRNMSVRLLESPLASAEEMVDKTEGLSDGVGCGWNSLETQ